MSGSPSTKITSQKPSQNQPLFNPPPLPPENCPNLLFAKPALFFAAKPALLIDHGKTRGGGGEGKGWEGKAGAQLMQMKGVTINDGKKDRVSAAISACEKGRVKRMVMSIERKRVLQNKTRLDNELSTCKHVRSCSSLEVAGESNKTQPLF